MSGGRTLFVGLQPSVIQHLFDGRSPFGSPMNSISSRSCNHACDTLGGAIGDTRERVGKPTGPFADEATFTKVLRNPDDPARAGHRMSFTHADLNSRNILVDEVVQQDGSLGWRVTGIVDWEMAGYYPEYWEYTKALYERFR